MSKSYINQFDGRYNAKDESFSLHQFLELIGIYKWWIVGALVFGIGGGILRYRHNPTYWSEGTLIIRSKDNSSFQAMVTQMAGTAVSKYYEVKTALLRLRSRNHYYLAARDALNSATQEGPYQEVNAKLLSRVLVNAPERKLPTEEELASYLSSRIKVAQATEDTITVSVTTSDAALAVFLTNHALSSAVKTIVQAELQEVSDIKKFVGERIELSKDRLADIDESMIEVHRNSKIPISGDLSSSNIFDVKKELAANKLRLQENQARVKELQSASQLQVESLSKMSLVKNMERENRFIESKIKAGEAFLKKLQKSNTTLHRGLRELAVLKRNEEMESSVFQELKKELLRAEIQNISSRNKVSILEPAYFPMRKSGLRKNLTLSPSIALIFLAIVIYLVELISPRIRGRADLKPYGVKCIGTIPKFDKTNSPIMCADLNKPKFCDFSLDTLESRTFRGLRGLMAHEIDIDKKTNRVISVTSCTPSDGKTFISTNFALAFASGGTDVLLIDSDFRRPRVATNLGIPNKVGFSDYLTGKAQLSEIIVKTKFENLDVITIGKSTESLSDLAGNERLPQLIKEVRKKYRLVFIDTAPILPVVDASTIAMASDFVLFSMVYHKTKKSQILSALDQLSMVDRSRFFALLNRVHSGRLNLYSYQYLNHYKRDNANKKAA